MRSRFTQGSIQHFGKDRVTINFADRSALKELTRSILMQRYQIKYWDVPEDYLVPCFTMRLNYLKWVASLLGETTEVVRGLDMYFFLPLITTL